MDEELLEAFIRYLREDNQVNGSFYLRDFGVSRCGLDPVVFGDPHPPEALPPQSATRPRRPADPPASAKASSTKKGE